jgi:hypothetical protein
MFIRKNEMKRKILTCVLGIGFGMGALHAEAGSVHIPAKPGASYSSIIVKLTESAQTRNADGPDAEIHAALSPHLGKIGSIVPLFVNITSTSRAGDPQGLTRYYRVFLPFGKRRDVAFINDLLAAAAKHDGIDMVYPDSWNYGAMESRPSAAEPWWLSRQYRPPSTRADDFTYLQFYRYAANEIMQGSKLGGIDVEYAWRLPGGRGEGVTIITQELGRWNPEHADLPTSVRDFGYSKVDDRNTAAAGILAATDNGFGVTGIVSKAALGHASADVGSFGELREYLKPGDVLVLSMDLVGWPVAGCDDGCSLPMETDPVWFDAIKDLTDRGVVVVEPAGNGGLDLDQEGLDGTFDRTRRDSGAIMVGAVCGSDGRRASFSNYGSRIDSSSWGCGDVVTTTGSASGADLWNEPGNWYTGTHWGTWAASPIVGGAAASVSGYARAKQLPLTGTEIRTLLTTTGTLFQEGDSAVVGTQPDLQKAFKAIDTCVESMGY